MGTPDFSHQMNLYKFLGQVEFSFSMGKLSNSAESWEVGRLRGQGPTSRFQGDSYLPRQCQRLDLPTLWAENDWEFLTYKTPLDRRIVNRRSFGSLKT